MTRNCVDADSSITSSHGGVKAYLYDRDNETIWKTEGANRDNVTVTLDITFKIGSVETEFNFNRLMILNTNIKNVLLEKYDSATGLYSQVFQDLIPDTRNYGCWYFGAVLTSRIRITITGTKLRNKEKEIGELIVTRVRRHISRGMTVYDVSYREKQSIYELGDGGMQIAYARAPGLRVGRYHAMAVFSYLTREDFEFLRCIKDEGQPFLWYPESITRPDEVWYVHWVNPFTANYTALFAAPGYTITMELSEV